MNSLDELRYVAANCRQCNICNDRNKPAFDRGDINSGILICGMCPGPDENEVGIPFVGPAGKLLNIIIENSIEVSPYITNIVKCFVKPGIKLKEDWMYKCLPYFILQLDIINPKVIVTLGSDVSNFITGSDTSIGKLRNKEFNYMGIPVICTYHPSYYARGGGEKHKDFYKGIEDLKYVNKFLGGDKYG